MGVGSAVDYAHRKGNTLADDFVVVGREERCHQIRFARNQITISKIWDEAKLDVFMAVGSKNSITTVENIQTEESIKKELHSFAKFVRSLPENPMYQGIYPEALTFPTELRRYYDKRIEELPGRATDIVESAIHAAEEEGANQVSGSFFIRSEITNLQTSVGTSGRSRKSSFEMTVRAFSDSESSGMGLTVGRNLDSLHADKAGREAGMIANRALGGKLGSPSTYDLVLHPVVAADLLGNTVGTANPIRVMLGLSCMGLEKLGTKVASDLVSVMDDGIVENGLCSDLFDMEGAPRQRTQIIKNGVLEGYIHNTTTAAQMGLKSTGNCEFADILGIGVRSFLPMRSNLIFNPGDYSPEELLTEKGVESRRTIYVTANWYTRFTHYQEGTFSSIPRDDMFLIDKDGEWSPIRQLRISDNLLKMLSNVVALGNDIHQIKWWEVTRPVFVPHVRVENVRLSTGTN